MRSELFLPLADSVAESGATATAAAAMVVAITGMLTAIVAPLLMAWLGGRQRSADRKADYARQDLVAERLENAQEDAAALAKTAEEKLDKVVVTGAVTHSLVNSAMTAQLKISAVALRRVADLSKHPDDIKAAELAEKALEEHEANAKKVDAQAVVKQQP